MNHDALFKKLLTSPGVLRGFFEAFLPEAARFVDFDVIEFVDKEQVTLQGRKRTGDLLVKTRFKSQAAGFLIHFEHQAQPDPDLGRRMLEYVILDSRTFDLPVYPIAVLSHREPAPEQMTPLRIEFPNRTVLQFDFDVIDLARMDAQAYVRLPNPAALALAARMKFRARKRIQLQRDFFVSLAEAPVAPPVREFVAGFFSAYQPLNRREALQLNREVSRVMPEMVREKAMRLTNPFIELGRHEGIRKGIQKGIREGIQKGIREGIQKGIRVGIQKGIRVGRREGRQEGEVELVLRLLRRRLGVLPALQEKAIRKLELPRIEALGDALLEFSSRSELTRWLRTNS